MTVLPPKAEVDLRSSYVAEVPEAAILVGEAEQRRAAPEDALWMDGPDFAAGYEFNLPFERRGVGSDGGPRR
jgi:hypothetical protein